LSKSRLVIPGLRSIVTAPQQQISAPLPLPLMPILAQSLPQSLTR
jgi:hypothetical protein